MVVKTQPYKIVEPKISSIAIQVGYLPFADGFVVLQKQTETTPPPRQQ